MFCVLLLFLCALPCYLYLGYRDKWNRTVVRRISRKHNHSIKTAGGLNVYQNKRIVLRCCKYLFNRIKGKVRARGTRGQQWYSEGRVQMLRKKCRTQSLFNLHIAGDWHYAHETLPLGPKPHMTVGVLNIQKELKLDRAHSSNPRAPKLNVEGRVFSLSPF